MENIYCIYYLNKLFPTKINNKLQWIGLNMWEMMNPLNNVLKNNYQLSNQQKITF